MKFEDALKRYLNRECVVTTRDDEYVGILTEIGEEYILLIDEESEYLLNIAFVESVSVDNE